jgi:glycosyltransferase involved in cell wall biosynthesis
MRQVDWVVVPSIWWENSPLVIQEAFLHGRPLLTSDIGGMKEKIADDVNGLHFRVGSAEDLADKLTSVLEDPEAWERLRAGAPKPIGHEEAARQHLALYRSIASAQRTELPASARRRHAAQEERTA